MEEKKTLKFGQTTFEGMKLAEKGGWELYVNPEKGYALLVSDGKVVSLMSGESILELLIEKREEN